MHYDCLIVDDETAIASSTSEYFNLFELSSAYVTSYEQCIDFLKRIRSPSPAGYQSGRPVRLRTLQEAAGTDGYSDSIYQRPHQRRRYSDCVKHRRSDYILPSRTPKRSAGQGKGRLKNGARP